MIEKNVVLTYGTTEEASAPPGLYICFELSIGIIRDPAGKVMSAAIKSGRSGLVTGEEEDT